MSAEERRNEDGWPGHAKHAGRRRPSVPGDGEAKPERRAGGRRQVDDAFEDLLEAFTAHLDKVRYLAFGTRHTYANWVRDYYRWLMATEPGLSLADVSPATIRALVDFKRDQKIKPATIGTILQALNRFYDFLFLDDPTRPNPTKGIKGPQVIEAPATRSPRTRSVRC